MREVTVLMTVYNGMPYLPAAVDSILGQTLTDFELLIVNDGSTDDSAAYLDNIEDPRVRVLHTPNRGLPSALNHGLESCHTEFVARMDCDDIALPTRLEEQLAFMKANPDVGLAGTQIERLGEMRTGGRTFLPCDHDTMDAQLMEGISSFYHPTVMFRTEIMKRIGGYWPHPVAEDWDMMLRMAEAARVANLDRVLLSYRFHMASATGAKAKKVQATIAYSIECARRRRAGEEPIGHDEFMAARRKAPLRHRFAEAAEVYARRQYRTAVGEMLGSRPIRGRLRVAWSALFSPRLTLKRVWRILCNLKSLKCPNRVAESRGRMEDAAGGSA